VAVVVVPGVIHAVVVHTLVSLVDRFYVSISTQIYNISPHFNKNKQADKI